MDHKTIDWHRNYLDILYYRLRYFRKHRPNRVYYYSMRANRWMDIGRRKLYLGTIWYHYEINDTNKSRPIR